MKLPVCPWRVFAFAPVWLSIAISVAGCASLSVPGFEAHSPKVTPAITPVVVAAEPDAAQAGLEVLRRGGTAADAAVAVQATLSLVEPQSSGLGGGAFMLYYEAATGRVTAFDGRETAPSSATPERFLKPDGTIIPFPEAVTSGRATGVPGALIMLDAAQARFGRLEWDSLFDAPIRLAREGFVIAPRLGYNLETRQFPEKYKPDFQAYFSNGQGGLRRTGEVMTNPAYAEALERIAAHRSGAIRSGPLAEAIVERVNAEPLGGGMTLADLAAYAPKDGPPLCRAYRVRFKVCVPPAPSGGPSLLEGLGIAEHFPLAEWGADDPRSWAVIIEAERLIYADRDRYMADPAFVSVPVEGLLAVDYLASRAALITPGTPTATPVAGRPVGADVRPQGEAHEPGGTSHFVIMDSYGNALSLTTTVEFYFGSGRMAGGFFLNNQLTDFSFTPVAADGMPAANAVEAGKRPRSAMSPVMVFDQSGRLVMLIGSPGGASILSYNLKTLIGVIDFGLDLQSAIDLPNVVARGDSVRIERARTPPNLLAALTAMGYSFGDLAGEESGLNGVWIGPDGAMTPGVDRRRNAVALTLP